MFYGNYTSESKGFRRAPEKQLFKLIFLAGQNNN